MENALKVRQSCGYKIFENRVLFVLSGVDAGAYLQSQTSNDVLALEEGQGQANTLLDRKGHLRAHFVVFRLDNQYWIVVEAEQGQTLYEHLEAFHFVEDVTIETQIGQHFVLLQGPASLRLISSFLQINSSLSAYGICRACYQEQTLIFMACSETGEEGGLFLIPEGISDAFLKVLLEAGQAFELTEMSDQDLEVLRIEAGIPRYGRDMSAENIVSETGLEKVAVSYDKGCYLGQEVVARIKTYGVIAQALIGICFEGETVPPFDGEIMIEGKVAGTVKSGIFSPTLQKPIALAYVSRQYREPGKQLTFEVEGTTYQGSLTLLPFYHPPTRQERAQALYENALTVFAEDQEGAAIKLLEEAIGIQPDFADAYESLGVILSRQERYEEAIVWMKKLADMAPNLAMARTNLSMFHMKMGNIPEAEKYLAEARQLEFKQHQQQMAGEKQKQQQRAQKEQMIEMFREVLETEDPEDLVANFGLGKALFDLEQYAEAISYLEKAIAIQPLYSAAYLHLGKALEFNQQPEQAREVYDRGIVAASQKGDLMPLKEMEQRRSGL